MNSIQTQQPAQSATSRSAPPAHHGPAVAAAATPMNRQDSNDATSPIDTPGLPATASWGSKAAQERRASRSTNASNPSPMTTNAVPAPQVAKPSKAEEPSSKKKGKEKEKDKSAQASKSATPQPQPHPLAPTHSSKPRIPGLDNLLKTITDPSFKFIFSSATLSEEDFKAIMEFPQLLDPNGGAKRRAVREKEKELAVRREAEAQAVSQQQSQQPAAEGEDQETTAGGSLQLGGEPEEAQQTTPGHLNQHAIAPPGQQSFGGNLFGQSSSLAEDFGNLGLNNTRGLTQQQQQNLLLSNFKAGPQSAGLLSNFPNNQGQQSQSQIGNAPGHGRHASRFSFANDSSSASASVQPVANQKIMSQQSSMMPKNSGHFNHMSQHQPLGGQFYTSGVQGPPPGLKATGTPPVSGGGMFGQGHGFATGGLGYGANARNNNDALYQDLLRGRNMDGARVADAGKRESMFPSFLNQHPTTSTPAPAPGLLSFPYGPSPGAYQESGSQKSKKKGKKHRHANTSSSGGGGVVDVQDPSILQARLHQGGGMAGQGLYGQGQGGFSSLNNYNNYGGAGRW
jgi:CCR4-NOT transcription complex subunit 4